jgi:hypothetical protein
MNLDVEREVAPLAHGLQIIVGAVLRGWIVQMRRRQNHLAFGDRMRFAVSRLASAAVADAALSDTFASPLRALMAFQSFG